MAYNIPSVSDFKTQFQRDFPYAVPAWGAAGTLTVAAGIITAAALTAGGQGFTAAPTVTVVDPNGTGAAITATLTGHAVSGLTIGNGGTGYTNPSLVFSGGAGDDTDLKRVVDSDISGGILDASYNVSQALFDSQATFSRAFLYLAAHCMIEKIQAAGQGLASQYNWLTVSKGVGDVTSSFQIPDKVLRDPMLAAFSTTRYGAMYLQIIAPLLVGNIGITHRRSLP